MSVSLASLGPAAQKQAAAQINAQAAKPTKAPKYRNVAVVVDGYRFDSKREAERYVVLAGEVDAKRIRDLKVQPAFRCEIAGVLICDVVADFSYRRNADNAYVVEDVKSKATKTAVYRMKAKLVRALHHVEITEVA